MLVQYFVPFKYKRTPSLDSNFTCEINFIWNVLYLHPIKLNVEDDGIGA